MPSATHLPVLPATLPCVGCPHGAVCCSWGVDLDDIEARALAGRYGEDKVYWNGTNFRTAVGPRGRCVFQAPDGLCTIHTDPHYPAVCNGFPWRSATSHKPYTGDLTVCPELRPPG